MKSRQFGYIYSGNSRFSQKEYIRYINSEIYDTDLENQKNKANYSKLLIPSTEEKPRPKFRFQRLKELRSPVLKLNQAKNWKLLWVYLPGKVIDRILDFLKPKEVVCLMITCKDFNQSLAQQFRKIQTIRILKAQFSDKNVPGNPDFLRDFHESLKYPITDVSDIFSSQTLFSCSSADIQHLTRYLIDFQSLKDTTAVTMLESDTLFLSYIPQQSEMVLWVVSKRSKAIVHFVVRKYRLKVTEEIVSAKFCTERYLLIQTREKLFNQEDSKSSYRYEIHLVDVNSEILNIFNCDDKVATRKENLHHNISIDFCLYENRSCQKLQLGKIKETKLEAEGDSLLTEFNLQKQASRVILYTQNQGGMILVYNLQKRVIEAAYMYEFQQNILGLVVSKRKADANSLNMLLIDSELSLHNLKYTYADKNFDARGIKFSDASEKKSTPLTKEYRKYQYGVIYNQGTFILDYIILYQNNEFWYLDLDSLTPKRIVQTKYLEKHSINSWYAHEDLLAVMYDRKYVTIFKITLEGDFKELTKEKQPILYKSRWATKEMLVKEPLEYSRDFEVTKLPPCLLMNHSYLIVIEFPPGTQGFNIYSTSLPEILMDKKVSTEGYLYLNANKTACEVRSKDIFNGGNPDDFLERCNEIVNYEKMAKVVDSKILLKLENVNIFFNFESITNFLYNQIKFDYISGIKAIDKIFRLDLSIPQISKSGPRKKQSSTTAKEKDKPKTYVEIPTNDNHSKPMNVFNHKSNFEYRVQTAKKKIEKLKYKLKYGIDVDIDNGDFPVVTEEPKMTIKLQRKIRIKEVLMSISGRFMKPENFVIKTFNLHSITLDFQRDWYLRRIRKRKTRKERTYNRDLRMEKADL